MRFIRKRKDAEVTPAFGKILEDKEKNNGNFTILLFLA
jgi:hypothetical protein